MRSPAGKTRLVIALRDRLVVARGGSGEWTAREHLEGKRPMCVATDPSKATRVYCGTANEGLWLSDDAGDTWRPAGPGIRESRVTAVAVVPAETHGAHGDVYVGTEPSLVYRSENGGETWLALDEITKLPSSSTWSFPPRPETHHVRWLQPDPHHPGRIFACVEAGALLRTDDRGLTWHDRVAGGPYDTHTLATHPVASGRLYSAAGDGYFESDDAGASWHQPESGLRYRYLFGVAVDPGDPGTVLVSAAPGPFRAYDPPRAESAVYRKSAGHNWEEVHDGLPDGKGTTVSVLAATAPRVFWAANNRGVFRSVDGGRNWERVSLGWPDAYSRSNVLAFSASETVL